MTFHQSDFRPSLFIFIDESGNFDFSPTGTKYFVMAGIVAAAPLESALRLQRVKYSILESGHSLVNFHASQDLQWVREKVFTAIREMEELKGHVIYGNKNQVPEYLKSRFHLHGLFAREFVKLASTRIISQDFDQVIVIFDQALNDGQQGAFRAAIKREMKNLLKPCRIYFHPVISDFNGQIADYVAWAKFKQLERGENRPWESLMESLGPTEQNIFE